MVSRKLVPAPILPVPIICYRNDAIVKWPTKNKPKTGGGKKEQIGGMPSRKSLTNLVFLLNNCNPVPNVMLTLTMHPDVEEATSVEQTKRNLQTALQHCRREGMERYVWVREFTLQQIVHFHIFIAHEQEFSVEPGQVDFNETRLWSRYWANLKWSGPREALDKMSNASARWERLSTSAAGRYAGKEAGKRFQKIAPSKWRNAGRWWGAARGFTVPIIAKGDIDPRYLASFTLPEAAGSSKIAFRVQYGLSKRLQDAGKIKHD